MGRKRDEKAERKAKPRVRPCRVSIDLGETCARYLLDLRTEISRREDLEYSPSETLRSIITAAWRQMEKERVTR
jgi:hypothetical protein